ncbi:MAG TPA: peptidase M61 [Stellaceae bacterium]|nr:peptidase M61 [Stellaceae bacterium]
MKSLLVAFVALASAAAQQSQGPTPAPMPPELPAPQDRPYPGTIRLAVDATDTMRGIFRVRETVPVRSGPLVLLFPKWIPGNHGPSGPIDKFAGLLIRAGAKKLAWLRDTVDVYAFHVTVPAGVHALDCEFQFLSPVATNEGRVVTTPEMLNLEWNTVALYPAGYFSRDITVQPSVKLPAGWKFGSALETASAAGGATTFKPVTFNTLVDSPIFAGRYFERVDLDPGGSAPVHMDIVADRPDELAISPAELQIHRNLAQQAYRAFGSHHYDHYDFLLGLSKVMSGIGLEHHRSSEDGTTADYFKEWDKTLASRDLLSHEYTHSWNGKFRRPADLWAANFNVPERDSLLWVYEGQTQYWGTVLAARSGLWTKQQALDALAADAATFANRAGLAWRPLQDTTNDPITTMRRPIPWRSWQRSEDYYGQGELIWLGADTLIRQKTGGRKSLDDFARAFFGIDNGSYVTVTYTFDDIVRALNAVLPYDWAGFLRSRLDSVGAPAPLDGLARGGYRLVYTDKPSDFTKSVEHVRKITDLLYSIGVIIDDKEKGSIAEVLWGGPAFNAGVVVGSRIVSVNGVAYDPDELKDAIAAARTTTTPIKLLLKRGDRFMTVPVNYRGGLRYPHLAAIPGSPPVLDAVLAARR